MTNIITIITVKYYKHLVITETLTLERMEGSAEMTAERDFIAFVLMATALSVSTLRICEQHKLKIISWILLQLVTLKVSHTKQALLLSKCTFLVWRRVHIDLHMVIIPGSDKHQSSSKMISMKQDILWLALPAHSPNYCEKICKIEHLNL